MSYYYEHQCFLVEKKLQELKLFRCILPSHDPYYDEGITQFGDLINSNVILYMYMFTGDL